MPVQPHHPEALTRSVEDYLKAIYHLSDRGRFATTRGRFATTRGRFATTSEIAQRLGLSAPSVTGMVKRLSEQGLLTHEPYRGVHLTGEGRRVALRMLRRHRLIESYLVGFLGYRWDAVHAEAERLEHAVSDDLVERMAAALGHPAVDPHGDPIPSADGTIEKAHYTPLPQFSPGESAEIRQVTTNDAERLRYLATLGLLPGTRLTVQAVAPFGGPITIRAGKRQQVLGAELAGVLLCARQRGAR
jgi:DtxR family Mn-dependent transcriptional regulator